MPAKSKCLKCGAPLKSDAQDGVCPKCLLEQALKGGEEMDDMKSSIAGLKVGYIGDYELVEEIARGGMGVVFKARQISLNRMVALKMILSGELATEAEVKRFRQEAEAAANLDHPNIVAIYEVGQFEGQHYFSMQFIEGESLAAERQRSEVRDQKAVAKLLATVARAVHYAHQRGILHRDLKPGNILIDDKGEPHVTDFGLAKKVEGASSLTLSGSVLGTPSFMAPEQAAGTSRQLTAAADIYSLGAVLYYLLTGRPPFEGQTPLEVMRKVVDEDPIRPSLIPPRKSAPRTPNSAIDRDLETICLKCLEKAPHRRYASADALAEDLERWFNGEPILARPANPMQRVVKWVKRKPAIAGLAASVIFLVALGLLQNAWRWRNPEKPITPELVDVGPAVIMVQPGSQTAPPGSKVTFVVVAGGKGPLSFQWKKNGVVLIDDRRVGGANTDKLSIANVQSEDLGRYTVIVSNVSASTRSAEAYLHFTPPSFAWSRGLGGSGKEGCGRLAIDRYRNVYLAGDFNDSAEFGNQTLKSVGSNDMFVAKFTPEGKLLWARSAGGPGDDSGGGIAVDGTANVYVCGKFIGTGTFADRNLTGAGKRDIYIAKYTDSGMLRWVIPAGGKDEDESYGLAVSENGNCYITGYFHDSAIFGDQTLTSRSGSDAFMAAYDGSGTFLWARSAGGAGNDSGANVVVNKAGDAYFTGWIYLPVAFGDSNLAGAGGKDFFVAKFNPTGILAWVRKSGAAERETGRSVAADAKGNAFVVANANDSLQISVTKYDADGAKQWQRQAGASDGKSGRFSWGALIAAVNEVGDCYVAGGFHGNIQFDGRIITSVGEYDTFVAKYDPVGRLIWVQQAAGTGQSYATGIAVNGSGEVYVCGIFSGRINFGDHTLTSRGDLDVFLAKLTDWPQTTGHQSMTP